MSSDDLYEAGVLVAIAANNPTWWTVPGLAAAVFAAVFAVRAFVPRRFRVLDVGGLRTYLRAHERLTTLRLLDTEIELIREQKSRLERNTSFLKYGLWMLVLAAGLLVAGTIDHLARS